MPTQRKTDYSGTPLHRKLGIREESVVRLVSAPPEFSQLLGPLPEGAEIVDESPEPVDVVIFFVSRLAELGSSFPTMAKALSPAGGLWVCWPKKVSKIPNDLTFELVQEAGLAAGLVDNKSCTIDHDWQALRFVYRRKDRKQVRLSDQGGTGGAEA